VTDPKRGFALAFAAACEAAGFDTAEVHPGHATEDRTTRHATMGTALSRPPGPICSDNVPERAGEWLIAAESEAIR